MRNAILCATAFAAGLCFAAQPATAAQAVDLSVISDASWRTSATLEADWETVDFDDSAWANARAPYPSSILPTDLVPGTTGEFIWHDPDNISDGQTGDIHAYLRVSFELDLLNANASLTAIAKVAVDDDYDLYVNGTLAMENHDSGYGDLVDDIDLADYLRHGINVIAIHAVDGSWDNPRQRGYERVLFDARITSEPRIVIPVLSGSDWRSSATLEPGWEEPDFDDSGWPPARAPYPGVDASTLIPDTRAESMWHDPGGDYDGSDGPVQAFFRHHFDIPSNPAALPFVGQLRVNVDDDYSLYVNGVPVLENHDEGLATVVDFVDVTYALRVGHNVIALHAVDGGWSSPYDRASERAIVEGLVASGTLEWEWVTVANMLGGTCLTGPALDDDTVVFMSLSPFEDCVTPAQFDTAGVYAVDINTGVSTVVAQKDMVLPDGTGVFDFEHAYSRTSIDGENIAFRAVGVDPDTAALLQKGVYARIDGSLRAIATTDTAIPSGTGNFTDPAPYGPSLDRDSIVFHGLGTSQEGLYSDRGGTLHALVDLNTPVPPGASGFFANFGRDPDHDGPDIAFAGCSSSAAPCFPSPNFDGIYLYNDDLDYLTVVAGTETLIPSGSGNDFDVFYYLAYKDGQLVFSASSLTGGESGIYTWRDGGLEVVADVDTPIPDTGDLFNMWNFLFAPSSTDGSSVVFSAVGRGIYTNMGGRLTKVIAAEDSLPGVVSRDWFIEKLILEPESLSRNQVALLADALGSAEAALIVARDIFGFAGDLDGDGVADNADNCILEPNGAQSDTNGDGYGNACDPDLDNDLAVSFSDLGILKSVFFSENDDADLDQDGFVSFSDLGIMKKYFFDVPGPSALTQ